MDKVAYSQVAELLKVAHDTLPALAKERDLYREKCAQYERRERAEKVAEAMHRKGIETDTDLSTLADRLEKAAEAGKLDVVQQAVDFVSPDMGTKLAQLTNDESRIPLGSTDLERYLVGGVG